MELNFMGYNSFAHGSRFTAGLGRMLLTIAAAALCLTKASASENAPHRPFAMWADLPEPGQFSAGIVYEESEAYHFWAGHNEYAVRTRAGGESYGIDINQGYIALQYGIREKWALDLNVGATTAGYRYFSDGKIKATTGLMDSSFGVRYQIFNEEDAPYDWIPTLTFRAGAVLPGSYNQDFAFAPGMRSAAIEPEFLLRKSFGWPGLGAYGDALYRWNRTTGNDQFIGVIGLFQKIHGWELDAGYRHLQTVNGSDITFDPSDPTSLDYPRDVREINDSIEAGFSYTTAKRHIRYGFHSRTVFDGVNTDRKFWVGGSVDIPFSF
ncbi:MAG TPA: hypothetical protein VHH88_05400 [Verrucomicrobiae bacterium]|nr:hypothetical protein [Verrucomicrobiae bacterium]